MRLSAENCNLSSNVSLAEHQYIWLGASLTGGSFVFADGTWHYSFWAANQPDNSGGNENCVATIDYKGYTWNDVDCSIQGIAVCQISFPPSNTPPSDQRKNEYLLLQNLRQYFIFSFLDFAAVTQSCPLNWVDTSTFNIPGCILMQPASAGNQTANATWGYGENVCQQLDPRAHLPILTDPSQFNNFKMAAR